MPVGLSARWEGCSNRTPDYRDYMVIRLLTCALYIFMRQDLSEKDERIRNDITALNFISFLLSRAHVCQSLITSWWANSVRMLVWLPPPPTNGELTAGAGGKSALPEDRAGRLFNKEMR